MKAKGYLSFKSGLGKNILLELAAVDALLEHVVVVHGRNLDNGTKAAAGADHTLHAVRGAGGISVPRKVDGVMDMGANADAMLPAVADAVAAVEADGMVTAVTGIVAQSAAGGIAVAVSADFAAIVAAAHVVELAALVLMALAALISQLEIAE